MAKGKKSTAKSHKFKNKLLLNQWLLSLFGVDPLEPKYRTGSKRPFHALAEPLKISQEGVDASNIHHFYHALVNSNLFWNEQIKLSKEQILVYEENIVKHTQAINEHRTTPIVWKYYQWLNLLFVELYLDRYFQSKEQLLEDLNSYVEQFNHIWGDYKDIPAFELDDLNKICMQNATGSGKTLIMHVNLMQYQHYARQNGLAQELSGTILLTPNERLSEQHIKEFHESGFHFVSRLSPENRGTSLGNIDVVEVTKLGDKEGQKTIATRNLGDMNLLLVDEGHRGMSSKEEGAWFVRRNMLCEKGFTFEYSATFEQAVSASKSDKFADSYAKTILFDYSYRWFYEDGFGKDYQILNLPETYDELQHIYLTACLLKFYQQLRIFEAQKQQLHAFNLEKPLWVFVGSTVSSSKLTKDEKAVATDIAKIIKFTADFLANEKAAVKRINELLNGKGQDTGLLDADGNDIFEGSFKYLSKQMVDNHESDASIYRDVLARVFNNTAGGNLILERVKGDSGEIALKVGTAEEAFGLINVGDAKGLCDHLETIARQEKISMSVTDSDFTAARFATIKDSSSPLNLLIGSKKFVEGWDCWRVSTMGLMHVGKTEGTQIIQLFGRGVRLKGHRWSLKRSSHIASFANRPDNISELETLNVFGVEADFMEKFRQFLKDEGLPGSEKRKVFQIPLNVTFDVGKNLKVLRPKRKKTDGKEYSFKKDGPVPEFGEIPDYFGNNPVEIDWYPRIQAVSSKNASFAGSKDEVFFENSHLAFLDFDKLYFEAEYFKRERTWHNLNITKAAIEKLLATKGWYRILIPEARMQPGSYQGVFLLQQLAEALLKKYCEKFYAYKKSEFIDPRLELRELTEEDENIPEDNFYQITVDASETQLIADIEKIKEQLEKEPERCMKVNDIEFCNFKSHLFQPLFHVRSKGKITILPVALNESEFQFVKDLKDWCEDNHKAIEKKNLEIYLLRNRSRGKGIGFFEAGNFYPDFILWVLQDGKQLVNFIDPHGLLHEGPGSEKVKLHKRIKEIEKRLNVQKVYLNSFILSWTKFPQLRWDTSQPELENQNIFFMTDDREQYIQKMFSRICG
jgi:hypothetical protein